MTEEEKMLNLMRESSLNNRREARQIKDPGDIPSAVLDLRDGIVKKIYDHSMLTSPRPNPVMCLAGAIAGTSLMMGRRYMAIDGTHPNVYILGLADSGCGKDQPRKVNREVALDIGIRTKVCDSFRSGAGLEDAVLAEARLLVQYDEFDTIFRLMKKDRTGTTEDLAGMMLTLYGDVASSHSRRQLSRAKTDGDRKIPEFCTVPYLTIFGTAIPRQFFDAMNERMLTNGLFARCIILPAGARPARNDVVYQSMPEAIVNDIRAFAQCGTDGTGKVICPEPPQKERVPIVKVDFEDDAKSELMAAAAEYDYLYAQNEDREDHKALWARAYEKVVKLALIYAVSSGRQKIDADSVKWGEAIVAWSTRKSLWLASIYCADNEFHDLMLKIERKIGAKPVDHHTLLRCLHIPAKDLNEALTTMEEAGVISVVGGTETNPEFTLTEKVKSNE